MSRHSIFYYPTKELSHDAVTCWLIKYSGYKGAEGAAERDLCAKFVKALLKNIKGRVANSRI